MFWKRLACVLLSSLAAASALLYYAFETDHRQILHKFFQQLTLLEAPRTPAQLPPSLPTPTPSPPTPPPHEQQEQSFFLLEDRPTTTHTESTIRSESPPSTPSTPPPTPTPPPPAPTSTPPPPTPTPPPPTPPLSWHRIQKWGFKARRFAKESTVKEFEAWDSIHGWSSADMNLSDETQWPPMTPCVGGWEFGLANPQIAVISMADRVSRREQFKNSLNSICMKEHVQWAPAMDGRKMPPSTIWLRGPDKSTWRHDGQTDKAGAWGCFVTHFAILLQFHERCAECDVIVFEDDVVFIPDFRNRWRQFFEALPEDWDIIRVGAQSLWSPAIETEPLYFKIAAMSNTWGYVIRAKSVQRVIDILATIPTDGLVGIDAMFNVFHGRLSSYAPRIPLIYANGACHDTEGDAAGHPGAWTGGGGCSEKGLEEAAQRLMQNWPLDYYHTFCKDHGKLLDESHLGRPGCEKNLSAVSCCPWWGVQNPPPHGKVEALPSF